MPSTASMSPHAEARLWGVQEYWILDPEHLRHHFYRREGELLVEYAVTGEQNDSHSVQGFQVKRSWLQPEPLPEVRPCFAEITGTL